MIWAAVTLSGVWFLCLRGWNWTRNDTFLIFWNLTCYPGLINTSKVCHGVSNKIQHHHMDWQTWIQRKIPSFINKELWPARSPDFNPLNFSIWFILEAKVSACVHSALDALKAKLKKEWDAIHQEQIRAACDAFVGRLKTVVRNKGGYIE